MQHLGSSQRDAMLLVRAGENFGFPTCNYSQPAACDPFAHPFELFPAHTDVGSMGISGRRIYLSEFGFVLTPQVVTMPLGGPVTPFITGFSTGIDALGVHGGWVYVGDLHARSSERTLDPRGPSRGAVSPRRCDRVRRGRASGARGRSARPSRPPQPRWRSA